MPRPKPRRKPKTVSPTSRKVARLWGMERWELIVVAVFSLAVIAAVWFRSQEARSRDRS